jgi:2-polyprenyl-3-methyl-5-hydroxy-6-metoxy-1,4-benzoquinol methylase
MTPFRKLSSVLSAMRFRPHETAVSHEEVHPPQEEAHPPQEEAHPPQEEAHPPQEEAHPPTEDLPYSSALRDFERSGKILKRENIYGSGPPTPIVSAETLSYAKKYAGKRVLDVGCGIGAYVKALLEEDYECEGIESNRDYVAECIKSHLKVQVMDANQLSFPAHSFDTLMMIEVLEHLPEPITALAEAFRVARKNVIISVPNIDVIPIMSKYQVVPWHILEATHLNFFTPKILESVLRQFAAKVEVFTYGHFAPWITEKQMHMHVFGVGWKY